MRPQLIEVPASVFVISLVQIFLFFCIFIALLYDVTELTFFALIILSMGLGSYLWARASLNHVECKITLNRKRLFPGERLKIGIQAVNGKFLPILFKVHLFVPGAVAGSDSGQWISEEGGLLWFQKIAFFRDFFPNRRGVFDLGSPKVRGGDLFGFFFRHLAVKDHFEVVVYPRIVNIRSIAFVKREFFGIPGAKSPVEDPVFVSGTRDYQPGRPARGIHWKTSARQNRLQEKLCEPSEQEKVLFLLDVDGFEDEQAGEDFEKSLEVIASLILQMDRRGVAVGFVTNGNIFGDGSRIIPISKNSFQMTTILETLARVGTKNTGPVTDILSKGYLITWGVSSICFAWTRSSGIRVIDAFMKQRSIPVQFVLVRKSCDTGTRNAMHEKNTVYLEDILAPESRKK
jgi:uncharacterized protein (DUF58 family)